MSEFPPTLLDRLKNIKGGDSNLLDHTMVVPGSSGGTINAHNNHPLPTMLCGGSRLGIQHRGHIVKEEVYLGNLWQMKFGVMGQQTKNGQVLGRIQQMLRSYPLNAQYLKGTECNLLTEIVVISSKVWPLELPL